MSYKLRFVQHFRQDKTDEFLKLERSFMELEENEPQFPKGKRYIPFAAREPLNTLIWESEFQTVEEAVKAKQFLDDNILHKDLFEKQVVFFIDSYAEIYKSLEE